MGIVGANKTKNRYYGIFVIFLLFSSIFVALLAYKSPEETPPVAPIQIGAGNIMNSTIDKTEFTFDIPKQTVDISVTLNVTKPDTFFFYAYLPFNVLSIFPYANYNGISYQPNNENMSEIGLFSSHLLHLDDGSTLINASVCLNSTVIPSFSKLAVEARLQVKDSLLAINDPSGGRKSAIYTFFGGNMNWSAEMASFKTPMNQLIVFSQTPFKVNIVIPESYYFASSQPGPIEYYVNNKSIRLVMFSMDFLNGEYAQTLVCNFENPSAQYLKETEIFVLGILITLLATFAFEPVRDALFLRVKPNNSRQNEYGLVQSNNQVNNVDQEDSQSRSNKQETIRKKLDRLLNRITEDQQSRKKERFLSRVDGLNNLLLSFSIFLLGLLIGQSFIANDPLVSFPFIGLISSLIISFTIGLYGSLKNSDENRILGWSLVVSCIILVSAVALIVWNKAFIDGLFGTAVFSVYVIPFILFVVDILITMKFSRWLESKFAAEKSDSKTFFSRFLRLMPFISFILTFAIILSVYIWLLKNGINIHLFGGLI